MRCAMRLHVHPLDSPSVARGESRQMVEQKQADLLFVTGNGLDIDERACQLEYIHKIT